MNNFDHAAEATATSINSAGSAMRENEAFQESLEYQTNNLKATFQDLANNVIDKELISSVLKLGDAFLKLANTDIGVLVTKIGLLAGAGWGLSSLIQVSKIIPVIVGQFKNFGAVLSLVAEGSGTFGAALSAAGGAGAVALPIFLAVSAAIVGVVEAVKAYKDSHPDFDTAAQSVATLSDSLKTAQDRLDEINKLGWKDRTRAINEEEQELKDLIAQQERELQVAQMRQAMAAGEELSERTGYGQATRYTAISPNDAGNQTFTSMDEAVKSLAETEGITGESTDELKQKLLDLGYAFVTTTENTKLTADEMNALDTQTLQELSGSIKENGELNTYLKDSYQGLYEELAPTYEKLVNLENAQRNAIPGARELTDSERELKGAFEQLVGTMLSFESSGDNAYQTIANLANILGVTPSYARDLAVSMGLVDRNTRYVYDGLVQLDDGTWAVADGFNAVKTASNGVAESMSGISHAMAEVQGTTSQFVGSLFNMNGELTTTGQAALTGNQGLWSLANAEAAANQQAAQTNFDNLVSEILSAGQAASWSAQQLAQMFAYAGLSTGAISSTYGDITTDKRAQMAYGAREFKSGENLQSYLTRVAKENLEKAIKESDTLKNLGKNLGYTAGGGGGGSSKKSAEEKAAEEAEKQAKKAQKAQEKAAKQSQQAYESAAKSAEQAAQEAARAAEQAAEEAKQKILDSIQELKDASDDFWDSKTDAIEETNKELDRQKQLEEKLKALEEAKQKKILLYKNGQFQYDKDYGTIAKAQADYEETRDKIQRERELEQLQEMKDNATEIFNEMKDIVQNGGDVTQEMINNWLSQMQADGADYYNSNKKLLGEWLEWARGAITEFGLSISQAMNTLSASGGSSSFGTFGETPKLWGLNYWGEDESKRENSSPYVDFWHDMFKYELLGGDPKIAAMYGSVYVDYTKKILDGLDDVYEEQDYLQRNQAIKKLYDEMKKLTDQLGYVPDYLKDFMEIGAGLKSNIDIIAMQYAQNYDKLGSVGKTTLDAILSGDEDYMVANKSRIADIAGGTAEDLMHWSYRRLAGSAEATKQLWDKRTENDKKVAEGIYGDKLSQLQTMIDRAGGIVTDEIYKWATKNIAVLDPDATGLTSMYPDVTAGDKYLYQSQAALEQLGYHGFLGNFGHTSEGGVSASTAALIKNIILGSTASNTKEERRNRLIAGNISSIEDHLEDVAHGQAISQGYITKASDYISKMIAENSEKWFTLYDQTEKDKLHQQTEELRALQEKLQKANDLAEINNLLVHGEALLPNEKADFEDKDWKDRKKYDDWVREAEDLDDTAEDIRRQMELNAKRWFDADEKTKAELHRANEELSERLAKETGTNLSYSGTTGKWSKNATGTHNFKGGLSLVGENGPELRVLTRGDNIIPADKTANLWKWASVNPASVISSLWSNQANNNTSYSFNMARVELPNVTDAKSFVQGLKNYALQYSYKR